MLIVEDEPFMAMLLTNLVSDLDTTCWGRSRTRMKRLTNRGVSSPTGKTGFVEKLRVAEQLAPVVAKAIAS